MFFDKLMEKEHQKIEKSPKHKQYEILSDNNNMV